MARAVEPFGAWLTGRKRFQAATRAALPVFEAVGPRIRINPLARWTTSDLADYMRAHDLRENPLVAYGYLSIGCFPCTRAGEARRGRAQRPLGGTGQDRMRHPSAGARASLSLAGTDRTHIVVSRLQPLRAGDGSKPRTVYMLATMSERTDPAPGRPRLWTPEGFREDEWTHADSADALAGNGRFILPLKVFLDLDPRVRRSARERLGVLLQPGDELEKIAGRCSAS